MQVKKYRVLAWRLARITGYQRAGLSNINKTIPLPHEDATLIYNYWEIQQVLIKKYTRFASKEYKRVYFNFL